MPACARVAYMLVREDRCASIDFTFLCCPSDRQAALPRITWKRRLERILYLVIGTETHE